MKKAKPRRGIRNSIVRNSARRGPDFAVAPAAAFAVLFAAFLTYRLLLLWGSPILEPDIDELVTGVLPDHLLHGLLMPMAKYQFSSHTGGVVVEGLMAYGPFRWVGESAFALRLAPLAFSAALLAGLFALAWRHFGPGAALLAAAFAAFPPRYCLDRSLRAFANHAEIAAFVVFSLLLFYRSRDRQRESERWSAGRGAYVAALGLVAGFAVYFCYLYLIFLLFIPVLLWRGRRSWRDGAVDLALFAAALAIGAWPWRWFHGREDIVHHFASGFTLSVNGVAWRVGKTPSFLIPDVARRLRDWFQSGDLRWAGRVVHGRYFDYALLAVFGVAWGAMAWQTRSAATAFFRGLAPRGSETFFAKRDALVAPLILYVPWHIVGFAFWPGGGAGYTRYLHPLFPILFLLTALFAVELWRGRQRWAAIAVVAIVLAADLGGSSGLWRGFRPGEGFRWRGFAYSVGASMFTGPLAFASPDFGLPELDRIAKATVGDADFAKGVDAGRALVNGDETAIGRGWPPPEALARRRAYARGLGFVRWAVLPSDIPHTRTMDKLVTREVAAAFRDGIALMGGQHFLSGFVTGVAYLDGAPIDGHLAVARQAGREAFAAYVAGLGAASRQAERPAAERLRTLPTLFPPDLADDFVKGLTLAEAWPRPVAGVSGPAAQP